jgi:hypothetical protein
LGNILSRELGPQQTANGVWRSLKENWTNPDSRFLGEKFPDDAVVFFVVDAGEQFFAEFADGTVNSLRANDRACADKPKLHELLDLGLG